MENHQFYFNDTGRSLRNTSEGDGVHLVLFILQS